MVFLAQQSEQDTVPYRVAQMCQNGLYWLGEGLTLWTFQSFLIVFPAMPAV